MIQIREKMLRLALLVAATVPAAAFVAPSALPGGSCAVGAARARGLTAVQVTPGPDGASSLSLSGGFRHQRFRAPFLVLRRDGKAAPMFCVCSQQCVFRSWCELCSGCMARAAGRPGNPGAASSPQRADTWDTEGEAVALRAAEAVLSRALIAAQGMSCKNIAVFGGTGGVGLETIYQSLNQVRAPLAPPGTRNGSSRCAHGLNPCPRRSPTSSPAPLLRSVQRSRSRVGPGAAGRQGPRAGPLAGQSRRAARERRRGAVRPAADLHRPDGAALAASLESCERERRDGRRGRVGRAGRGSRPLETRRSRDAPRLHARCVR